MTFDIEQEQRELAKARLDNAIAQYQQAKQSEEDTEALEARLDEIKVLQAFQSERPRPQIAQWDDIPEVKREWLIDSWLPANTVSMFTGEGGAGKSWLTLQAVCQITCGFRDAYLDPNYKITPPADYDDNLPTPKHVVFATYEDEPAEIKCRLQALASGMSWIADSLTAIKQHLHIVDMRGIGSVWGPGLGKHIANTGDLLAAGEDLRQICEDNDARLLVMDPLSGGFGGNENERTAVYDFVSSFRGWGDTAKCAMLVIGHLPKSKEGKAAGFSGSTAWEASARSMWKLTKQGKSENEYWALKHTKSNYYTLQPKKYLCRNEIGAWAEATCKDKAIEAYNAYKKKYGIEVEEEDDE